MPIVLPLRLVVIRIMPFRPHSPERTQASPCGISRRQAMTRPKPRSATSSLSTSGVFVTGTPRARQASTSILSRPTPEEPTISRLGSFASRSAVKPKPPVVTTARIFAALPFRKASLSAAWS